MKLMQLIFLLHITGAAVLFDIKYRRIPNALILVGLLSSFAYQAITFQWNGVFHFFTGVFLTIILTGILYYFRMFGAGDIKLLSVIGGFLGPHDIIQFLIFTFLAGGVISAALLIKRRNIYSRFFYFKTYITQYLETRQWTPYMQQGCEDGYMYFSIPIFISLVCLAGGVY